MQAISKFSSPITFLSAMLFLYTVCCHNVAAQETATGEAAVKSDIAADSDFETITFESADGLQITADLYWKHDDKAKPFIVLCHQARWSRGEYREIAPQLNALGFNCLAIDQRSGGAVNDVENETMKQATAAGKSTEYVDAEQDMIAALKFVHKEYATGKVLLWGSSYSSALSLRIAGTQPDLVDGVLAFAPGEYFARAGKSKTWITESAKQIADPVFITSAKDEFANWKSIFAAIPGEAKTKFVPQTKGNHGSRALWAEFNDSQAYWAAVKGFLAQF